MVGLLEKKKEELDGKLKEEKEKDERVAELVTELELQIKNLIKTLSASSFR